MAFKSSGYISPVQLTSAGNSLSHLNSCDNDSDIDDLHPAALPETTSAGPGSIRGSGRESPEELEPLVAGAAEVAAWCKSLQISSCQRIKKVRHLPILKVLK